MRNTIQDELDLAKTKMIEEVDFQGKMLAVAVNHMVNIVIPIVVKQIFWVEPLSVLHGHTGLHIGEVHICAMGKGGAESSSGATYRQELQYFLPSLSTGLLFQKAALTPIKQQQQTLLIE